MDGFGFVIRLLGIIGSVFYFYLFFLILFIITFNCRWSVFIPRNTTMQLHCSISRNKYRPCAFGDIMNRVTTISHCPYIDIPVYLYQYIVISIYRYIDVIGFIFDISIYRYMDILIFYVFVCFEWEKR